MRTSARLQMLVAAVLLLPVGAPAAEPELAERCRGPEHRAFDFWVGNWQVRNAAGDLVGYNDVRRVVDGCGLLESWRGVSGSTGMSINTYDADRGKWTQRWVGAGASLWLEGGVEDGRMSLWTPHRKKPEKRTISIGATPSGTLASTERAERHRFLPAGSLP